jgi:transposase
LTWNTSSPISDPIDVFSRITSASEVCAEVLVLGHHIDGLRVFLTDPDVPLDNNRTERALRGVVLGRKNHFGSRSERGTKVAAMMYSLVETAKINGVDPELYLKLAALESIAGRPIPLPHQLG